jgi:23S rRNA pseudouridine1911/1915/1917 synthase
MNAEENQVPEEESERFEHFHYTADKGQSVLRLDKFLSDLMPNASRSKIQDLAKKGNILVNDIPQKQNYKVKPGDEVSVVMPYPVREIDLKPENIPLEIIYEDDSLVVINKQAGLVVHPGYGNYEGTLVNAMLYHFEKLATKVDEPDRPGLVHRLDKDTSGVMVIAKTEKALTNLAKQFFDRTNDRRYYALVWGDFDEDEGMIEGHIGRSLKDRKVMDVFPDGTFGKPAITRYKVLERFGYVTLVECKLESGRTHQIRAHFKFIKHPLFDDATYGGDKILKGTTFTKYKQFVQNCFKILNRQALHAIKLSFTHPDNGEWVEFSSPIPSDMQEVIDKWRHYIAHRKD